MPEPLTALDATFLELEQMDEGATMHIGGVMVFDPPPDGTVPSLQAMCEKIASRLTLLPRYSQRLSSERTGGLSWPRWQTDPQFDIRNHIHRAALPAPGGDAELCDWAADFFSHRLDRTRPLWEMALVEGLEHGRWALASKTHHCLVDGVGSVGVAQLLLDAEPSPPPRAFAKPPADEPGSLWHALIPHPPDAIADLARSGARAASAGAHAALHPRETLEKSRSLAEVIVRDEVIAAPHASLNVPIGATRRFEIVRASLPEVKAIGHELGGSINDVVLAACTSGLRRLLISRGEALPPEGLRAMVPMNVRAGSEQLALGNRVSSLFVELPVAEPDAFARLRTIVEHTSRLKSSNAALGTSTMIDLAALAPPLLHTLIARSLYATRLFNLTITNVPGPRIPLYAFGAALREIQPIVPLAAEHAVGIAIFSYNGGMVLGLGADCDSTPDLHVLAEGVEQGFSELDMLLRARAPGPPTKRKSTKRTPTTSSSDRTPTAGARRT
jgi:diacylglycerol O-acyltransferase / wax synthase